MASLSNLWRSILFTFVTLVAVLFLCELGIRMFVRVRNVGPSFTEYDPVYGKRIKKNVSFRRFAPEFTMRFTTNSLGFRGPEPTSEMHRPVLFIGDSFTMGYGVNDDEAFPELIRRALAKRNIGKEIAVLNTGMGVNGNGRWLKFLRRDAPRYAPRLVVLQFTAGDFEDNIKEGLFELNARGELRERRVAPPSMYRKLQTLIEAVPGLAYSYIMGMARQSLWVIYNRPVKLDSEPSGTEKQAFSYPERLTFRIVEEILSFCENHKWPVIALNVGMDGDRLAELKKRFARHHIPFFSAPTKEQAPELYFEMDGHWNASGHVFIADMLLKEITASRLGDIH